MTDLTVPRPALALGLLGLLPSLAMLAAMVVLPEWRGAAGRIGIAYGAVAAGFAGGTWAGLLAVRPDAAERGRLLAVSVLPALLAWPAVLLPPVSGLLLLALLFAVLPPTDARLLREGVAPRWWPRLRRPVSFGMAALHAGAAMLLAFSPASALP